MCFLTFGEDQDINRSVICESVAKCQVRDTEARRRVACGICHKAFELWSPKTLFTHLNEHFENLSTGGHHCDVCEIKFAHAADLERHLSSAAKGSCGFNFVHKGPCPGHHPPGEPGVYPEASDDDRFSFSYRLLHWEHAQLVGFITSVQEVQSKRAWTASDPLDMIKIASAGDTTDCTCQYYIVHGFYRSLLSDQAEGTAEGHSHLTSTPSVIQPLVQELSHCLRSISSSQEGTALRRTRSFSNTSTMFEFPMHRSDLADGPGELVGAIQNVLEDTPTNISVYGRESDALLLRASASGEQDLIIAAIALGANVNATDARGSSPLDLAIMSSSEDAVHLLLSSGATPAASDGWSATLGLAALSGDQQVLQLLLTSGKPFARDIRITARDVCYRGDVSSLKTLLRTCAKQLDLGLLMLCSTRAEVFEALLETGQVTTSQKNAALTKACFYRDEDTVNRLIGLGVKIEAADIKLTDANHPLCVAAESGDLQYFRLMRRCLPDIHESELREINQAVERKAREERSEFMGLRFQPIGLENAKQYRSKLSREVSAR